MTYIVLCRQEWKIAQSSGGDEKTKAPLTSQEKQNKEDSDDDEEEGDGDEDERKMVESKGGEMRGLKKSPRVATASEIENEQVRIVVNSQIEGNFGNNKVEEPTKIAEAASEEKIEDKGDKSDHAADPSVEERRKSAVKDEYEDKGGARREERAHTGRLDTLSSVSTATSLHDVCMSEDSARQPDATDLDDLDEFDAIVVKVIFPYAYFFPDFFFLI